MVYKEEVGWVRGSKILVIGWRSIYFFPLKEAEIQFETLGFNLYKKHLGEIWNKFKMGHEFEILNISI